MPEGSHFHGRAETMHRVLHGLAVMLLGVQHFLWALSDVTADSVRHGHRDVRVLEFSHHARLVTALHLEQCSHGTVGSP